MRPITARDIDLVRAPWVWDLGNRVLYDLCRTHPKHMNDDEIVAKVWLIGRSYAASIERRKNAEEIGDDFYEAVVAPLMRKSEVVDIDSWLESIENKDEPGTSRTIEVHKELMDLFHRMTGLDKRSLASKYLHFHIPNAFFIYDSRARQSITRVVPRLNQVPEIKAVKCDLEYRDFVRRCVWLRNHVHESLGELLTTRDIDKLLLMITAEDSRIVD